MPSKKAVLYDPNRRAAASIRDRVRTRRDVFDTLLPEMKARAFEVTGIDDMHALGRVQESIARIPEGGDWRTARKQVAAELTAQWDVAEGGAEEAVKRRAETILKANTFQAYAVSRHAEQQAFKSSFPYLKYITRGDSRTRPSHAELDGKILPVDDPFWKDHYPPWEYGCRCITVGLTAAQAEAAGITTEKQMESYTKKHGTPNPETYHHDPSALNIPLTDIVTGKTPEQAAYFAGTAIDNRVTMPDGKEQSVWRWTLDIKPGLKGATDAAKEHLADTLTLDGIETPEQIDALNTATEAFSAARISQKIPKVPEFGVIYEKNVLAGVLSNSKGQPKKLVFNPSEFQRIDDVFKENVTKRLEAGLIRHNAFPSAEETPKSIGHHETGHIVFNTSKLVDKDTKLRALFNRAYDSGDINAISECAKSKAHGREFFAEAFTMWKNREYLPSYILQFIKEVIK